MGDRDVLRRIGGLVNEQLRGERLRGGDGLAGDELARMRTMEVALERWGTCRVSVAPGVPPARIRTGWRSGPTQSVEGYAP